MEYQVAQTKLQILSSKLHYLLLISIGLLIANIFLVLLAGWSFVHQKRTIVPVTVTAPFTVSDTRVDASYLRQMALFFIAERLNVTAANVEQSHNLILHHTDSRFHHEFLDVLAKEKEVVKEQNISSVFYPEEIIPSSKKLSVVIKGTLAHWVGNMAIAPVKKTYVINFSYSAGHLKILSFFEQIEQS